MSARYLYVPGVKKGIKMASRLSVFVVFCLAASLIHAQSQANTGSIEGTVSDPAGRGVPGAAVTLLNTGTNFTRELTTDQDGRFRGLLLPLGSYKVTAKAPSFATLVRDGINLAVGQAITLPLTLSITATQETITVSAEAPIIETNKVE